MSTYEHPIIKLKITPSYELTSLHCTLTIESPQIEQENTIVALPLLSNNEYTLLSELEAFDEQGELPVNFHDPNETTGRSISVQRDTVGDVNISYLAIPSLDDKRGKEDPAIYLHDQAGILGSGLSFIPTPTDNMIYRNIVEWDLSKAHAGTRAVWTFGEGPEPTSKVGPASVLNNSVYMVGQIESNPPVAVEGSISDYYGYYWFGKLPPNIEVIKDIHADFFLKVSVFFENMPSVVNSYRSFVRNRQNPKSFGGTNFNSSQIFDYDHTIDKAQDYDLVRRMSHEMIHSFFGPPPTEKNTDLLYEGINNTLSIYLPFRNKFRTGDYFSSTLNMLCMKYYTNPLINVPQEELLSLSSTNFYAKEMLKSRMWAYVISTDFRARKLSKLMRPIEDLAIKPLAKKKANGKPHSIEQYFELLEPLMGKEVREMYDEMYKGTTIHLPVEVFGAKTHRLKRIDQEVLDFGINVESFEEGNVRGLKSGSRAEKAGLREGDVMVGSSHVWQCVDHFEEEMEVLVKRAAGAEVVRYWPRGFEKVESWRMVKVEDL